MGGLIGSWTRMREERQARHAWEAHHTRYNMRARDGNPTQAPLGSFWLSIRWAKRACRVHGVRDRCYRKEPPQ